MLNAAVAVPVVRHPRLILRQLVAPAVLTWLSRCQASCTVPLLLVARTSLLNAAVALPVARHPRLALHLLVSPAAQASGAVLGCLWSPARRAMIMDFGSFSSLSHRKRRSGRCRRSFRRRGSVQLPRPSLTLSDRVPLPCRASVPCEQLAPLLASVVSRTAYCSTENNPNPADDRQKNAGPCGREVYLPGPPRRSSTAHLAISRRDEGALGCALVPQPSPSGCERPGRECPSATSSHIPIREKNQPPTSIPCPRGPSSTPPHSHRLCI